jgi:FtsP/CotA-like multicopper oxidase with cupredoxin domain
MVSRREVLHGTAVAGSVAALWPRGASAAQAPRALPAWQGFYSGGAERAANLPPGAPGRDYEPVLTPNGMTLAYRVVDGVKVFHLVAEEVDHEFADGLRAHCWGYNGRVHGPTLEAVEGDRVRVYVTNRLPAATTVHWHGVFLPNGMDGVGGLNQAAIPAGKTFVYEWTFQQHGTFMYHSHHDEMTQMAMGMMGMIVVHPRRPSPDYRVDRDFALLLSEWAQKPGTRRPDPNEMLDFNLLTFNARCFPGTAPLVCKLGERVRIRLGNLSAMHHHPIHLHGFHFKVTATEGGPIPLSAQRLETTVLVPTGTTRDIEFIADAPGDWALHCHMTHHVMNQMGHGTTNMLGARPKEFEDSVRKVVPGYMAMGHDGMGDMGPMQMPVPKNSIPMVGAEGPFGYITMGGMFTVLKVRETLATYDDPGWYQPPPGTQARLAAATELARDGVRP